MGRAVVMGMSNGRKQLKREYRKYTTGFWAKQGRAREPGVLDRGFMRYMGYSVPISFRAWCALVIEHGLPLPVEAL